MNCVFASYFNCLPDPQRNILWHNQPDDLFPLIKSVVVKDCKIKIFHDCFNQPPDIYNCEWIRVPPTTEYALTVYRWLVYNDYLKNLKNKPEYLFCVDSTDVEMLKNPFNEIEPNKLYCGSEYRWKIKDKPLLKKKKKKLFAAPDCRSIIEQYAEQIMLNAGILGGEIVIISDFIEKVSNLHKMYSKSVKLSSDMLAFNYVALKYFNSKIITGYPVHTPFTDECYDNSCWWKHK